MLERLGGAGPVAGVELHLAQPDHLGGHLDALVLGHELEGLLERQDPRRREPLGVVRACGAHVRLLLLPADVDVHVFAPGVLADDHALVDVVAGGDEQRCALLDGDDRVGGDGTPTVGHHRTSIPGADLAEPGRPAVEDLVDHPGAAGLGQELGAEPEESSGRHPLLHANPAGAVVDDVGHLPLAGGQELGHRAQELLGHVDGHGLDRLVEGAVDLAGHHLRLADGQLEALASHGLHQDRQLELAAGVDLPGVGTFGGQHPQRHVADQLAVESPLEEAGGHLVAVETGHRRGVDADRHGEARLVDGDDRQRSGVVGIGERLSDRDVLQTGDRDDLTRTRRGSLDALVVLGHVEHRHLGPLDGAVGSTPRDGLALADRAVDDPAHGQTPHELAGVEVRHPRLQRRCGVMGRRRQVVDEQLEQRGQVLGEVVDGVRLGDRGTAGSGVAVDDREVELVHVRVEVEEQLLDLGHDLVDAGVGPVDLVDRQDHR